MAESCVGSYPLSPIASPRMSGTGAAVNGQFVVLAVTLMLDDKPWIGAAPLIAGRGAL